MVKFQFYRLIQFQLGIYITRIYFGSTLKQLFIYSLSQHILILQTHSQIEHYFFSYLLTCEVYLIEVIEISRAVGRSENPYRFEQKQFPNRLCVRRASQYNLYLSRNVLRISPFSGVETYTQYGPIKNSRIKNQPSDFGKKIKNQP